jgi:tyrosinase
MKISTFAAATLMSSVGAAPLEERASLFLETDALAAQGVFNLGLSTALKGYPSPKTCTLDNVAIRREW